jgi:polysaccharide deacetylase family protein (PEP-CTERM system associated)
LLSIDFEDWHQLVHRRLGLADWDRPHRALERQTTVLLDLLDRLQARATFFLLGMTVENHRDLVAEIVRRGHEPACHGYAHTLVHQQTEDEFAADLERAVATIEELAGRRPIAYRAPAFSINRKTPWAYDVLAAHGFRYDSSQHDSPRIRERLGGIPSAPYRLELRSGEDLWELPVAVAGRLPVGGGAYWRLLPRRVLDRGLDHVGSRTSYPVLYFHPYEFDRSRSKRNFRAHHLRTSDSLPRPAPLEEHRRALITARLQEVAQLYRLLSYEEAYDDIHRLYGARSRALSEEGVLV